MTRLKKINQKIEVISGSSKNGVFNPSADGRLVTEDGVELMLHRFRVVGGRPVLLLHGASAGADTFLTPRVGRKDQQCLVDYLVDHSFEPWLLDWRGSKDVTDDILDPENKAAKPHPSLVDFNKAAQYDIAAALDAIEYIKNEERRAEAKGVDAEPLLIDAIGYCMGSAILTEALLKDSSDEESSGEKSSFLKEPGIRRRLSHVVLMTIGLFYQMNVHGRMKAEAHLLKRVIGDEPDRRVLDPRIDKENEALPLRREWPEFVETLYQTWRHPYDEARMERENIPEEDRHALEMFNRVSFMLGEPYHETNLVPEIHHRLTTVHFNPEDNIGSLSTGTLIEARIDPADNVGSHSPGTPIEAKDDVRIVARGELAYPYKDDVSPDDMSPKSLVLYRCHRTEEQKRHLAQQDPPWPKQEKFLFWPKLTLLADGQSIGKVAADPDYQEPLLPDLLGALPLHLFMHGAENLRAGIATDLIEVGTDNKIGEGQKDVTPTPVLNAFEDNRARAYMGFAALDHLTLIGGGLDRLWHRDSVDRMGAWLERFPRLRKRWTKHMLLDYGHQDLLWGREASSVVFPKILAGLGKVEEAEKAEELVSDERKYQPRTDSEPETAA